MPVTLCILEENRDSNYEAELENRQQAEDLLRSIQFYGGYWTKERTVFVPWHRVDEARITEFDA